MVMFLLAFVISIGISFIYFWLLKLEIIILQDMIIKNLYIYSSHRTCCIKDKEFDGTNNNQK